ncbi:MAG: hypothetical protein CMF22_11765 [Idiomarinaceae bacterium]|nr:hypothetical protein [Idiomarinaceae bacterium]|tara:strand:- start:44272 stop:45000 length:729 start_codon:yes stop_codon:yes gene_type:complete
MQFEQFKEEIVTMLGDNMVEVELSDNDIHLAFQRAKRTYKQKGPDNSRKVFYCLSASKETTTFMIPREIDTIIKIIRPSINTFGLGGYGFNDGLGERYGAGFYDLFADGDMLSYELLLGKMESWRRLMNFDVSFQHDKHRSTLKVNQKPYVDEKWFIECYASLTDDEYREMIWIQDWALAEAKIILGTAYRKFSGIPDPTGSSVSLGGDQLIAEAQQEKERLLEDILNGVSGDVDYYGVYIG